LILCLKIAPRLYEVDDEQKDSVVIVVTGLPRNLSHAHGFISAEIKSKFREEVSMFDKDVAEEQADCRCLFSDLAEFEIDCFSQILYLCSHNLELDHFVKLLIGK
jgi:hypothetical protein